MSRNNNKSGQQKRNDLMAKVIVLGNSSVGKTSILTRYTWSGDSQDYCLSHTPTIGLDFKTKTVKSGEKSVKLQLWDTAGQQRFRTITDNYYTGVSGIVLVYSVSDRKSFQQIGDWMYKINSKADENIPKIILANKCQIKKLGTHTGSQSQEQRVVQTHQGKILAQKYNSMFLQVSAKQNINIEQAFTMLTNKMIQDLEKNQQSSPVMVLQKRDNKSLNINIKALKKQGNCCS